MRILYIVCPIYIEEKLESKHHVTVSEARQALLNEPRIRFDEKGYAPGEESTRPLDKRSEVDTW